MFAIIFLSVLGLAHASAASCPNDKCPPTGYIIKTDYATIKCAADPCSMDGKGEFLTGTDLNTCCDAKGSCAADKCPANYVGKDGSPKCAGKTCATSNDKYSAPDLANCCVRERRKTKSTGVITVGYTGVTKANVDEDDVANEIKDYINNQFHTAMTTPAPNSLAKVASDTDLTIEKYMIETTLAAAAGAANTVDVTFTTTVTTVAGNKRYATADAQKTAMNTAATNLLAAEATKLTALQTSLRGVAGFNAQATVVKKDVAVTSCVLDASTAKCATTNNTPAASPTGSAKPSSEPAAEAGGANAGVIAGAVIGSLAGVVIIGVIVYCTCCKKDDKQG